MVQYQYVRVEIKMSKLMVRISVYYGISSKVIYEQGVCYGMRMAVGKHTEQRGRSALSGEMHSKWRFLTKP